MRLVNQAEFGLLVEATAMKPRFKKDLKFRASTESIAPGEWSEKELLPIWNKSRTGGVVLLQPRQAVVLLPFESAKTSLDMSGRARAAICDFCYTWQSGGGVQLVTFYPDTSANSVSFLCCRELDCSDHVRTKTAIALKSRAQLREDLDAESRIIRLKNRLTSCLVEKMS